MKIHKVIAFVLSASVLSSYAFSAKAVSANTVVDPHAMINSADMVRELSNHLIAYYGGIESLDLTEEYYIGEEIPSYIAKDDNSLIPFYTTSYYTVYNGDEVIGVFSVCSGEDNSYTYSYSEKLADDFKSLQSDKYCIIITDMGDAVVDAQSDISKNITCFSTVDKQLTKVEFAQTDTCDIKTIGSEGPFILSVPIWNQTVNGKFYGLCWAGSTWCIGKYITGISAYDPFDLADLKKIDYDDGAGNSVVIELLDEVYGITAVNFNYVPTINTIKNNINDGEPIYMNLQATSTAHAMTLKGYYVPNDTTFVIMTMDTYGGTTRTLSSTNSTYSITYESGRVYTWDSAVVVKSY